MFLIVILSFIAAFVFSLGGIGAAMIIIQILISFGIPIQFAKPVGLLYTPVSLTGASISNIKNKRLDFKFGIPIITQIINFVELTKPRFIKNLEKRV